MAGRARQEPAAPDARMGAHGHGKRVGHVAPLAVLVFEQLAEGGQQLVRHLAEWGQPARETALVQGPRAPGARPIAPGGGQIAAQEAGPCQGRGQPLGSGEGLAGGRRRRPAGRMAGSNSSLKQYLATVCSVLLKQE